jgi:hypothetical protein
MSEDGRTFKAGDIVTRRGSQHRFEVISISGGWTWLDPLADSEPFSGRLEDIDFIEPAEPPLLATAPGGAP